MNWVRQKPKLTPKDLGKGFTVVFQEKRTDVEQVRAVVKSSDGSIYCRGPIVPRARYRATAKSAAELFHQQQREDARRKEMVRYSGPPDFTPSWVERSWGKPYQSRRTTAPIGLGFQS
jgi:hypothetical protein